MNETGAGLKEAGKVLTKSNEEEDKKVLARHKANSSKAPLFVPMKDP